MVRNLITNLQDRYAGKHLGFSLQVNSLVVTSDVALDKWLNAFEYHTDSEKRVELRALYALFPEDSARALFLSSLLERAAAIGGLYRVIKGFQLQNGIPRELVI